MNTSPVPDSEPTTPICGVCRGELEAVKYLDYENIRVVFHTKNGCVIGVLNN